jgi:hypothetical protein
MEASPGFSLGKFTKYKSILKNKHKKQDITKLFKGYILEFKPYNGLRWKIPAGIKVSQGVAHKFTLLNHISDYKKIQYELNMHKMNDHTWNFKTNKRNAQGQNTIETHTITCIHTKQLCEWNIVKGIYHTIFRFGKHINTLKRAWKIHKLYNTVKNTEDIVTMEPPKNPVYVRDVIRGHSFVFEASSIRKLIENRLLFSDYMFSTPLEPINPYTNVGFTLGQIYSIIQQCKLHGQYSWILDTYKSAWCNIKKFRIYNCQKLNIEAINAYFKKTRAHIRETVIDYFIWQADECDMSERAIGSFINIYDCNIDHPIINKWINMIRDYYIGAELKNTALIHDTLDRRDFLLNRIQILFNY